MLLPKLIVLVHVMCYVSVVFVVCVFRLWAVFIVVLRPLLYLRFQGLDVELTELKIVLYCVCVFQPWR